MPHETAGRASYTGTLAVAKPEVQLSARLILSNPHQRSPIVIWPDADNLLPHRLLSTPRLVARR